MSPSLDNQGTQILEKRALSEEELQPWKIQLKKEIEELKVVRTMGEEQDRALEHWVQFHKDNPSSLPWRVQREPPKKINPLESGQVSLFPTYNLEDGLRLELLWQ